MQITFPVTVWCYITLCPNSPVLPDHLSSHMRCQFGSNVQFLCNSLHRAMATFSPVSPQCSCMDTDIDADRIASVLKLANQISKSWDLDRPLHRLTDIDWAQITATPVRGAYTFTPSPETTPELDDACVRPIRRMRVSSKSVPSKEVEENKTRHLFLFGYLMEPSSLDAYISYLCYPHVVFWRLVFFMILLFR